jgi:hypothetical protein
MYVIRSGTVVYRHPLKIIGRDSHPDEYIALIGLLTGVLAIVVSNGQRKDDKDWSLIVFPWKGSVTCGWVYNSSLEKL